MLLLIWNERVNISKSCARYIPMRFLTTVEWEDRAFRIPDAKYMVYNQSHLDLTFISKVLKLYTGLLKFLMLSLIPTPILTPTLA